MGLEQALVQQGLGLGQVVGARVPQQQVCGTRSLVLVGLALPFVSLALLLLPLLSPSCLWRELSSIGIRARGSLVLQANRRRVCRT